MTHDEIKAVFSRAFNGQPNFMTRDILKFGKRGPMVWELSTGTGISNARIYGVTVIELPQKKRGDLSRCFHSLEAAKAYIKSDFQEVDE